MKIGIFGGSFNPIHNQHKEIVESLLRNKILDKIVIVPAGNDYNKPNLLNIVDRLNMISLAFSKSEVQNQIEISDFELLKSKYTIETLRYFQKLHPNDEIFFICGLDNVEELYKWHNYEEIISKYKILCVLRNNKNFEEVVDKYTLYKKNIILTTVETTNVSSTFIRHEIMTNGYTEKLDEILDSKVIEYLKNINLKEYWKI